ncbi:MAG TPA: hypothetical protein VI997_03550 [Candidatus Thermoplasmatota archaeon]|nr:hypothetical protein [Candidatus Thermoplasmatota archaeon]
MTAEPLGECEEPLDFARFDGQPDRLICVVYNVRPGDDCVVPVPNP